MGWKGADFGGLRRTADSAGPVEMDRGESRGTKRKSRRQLTLLAAFGVPRTRLELARTKRSLPPQSSVSTNFTTWAFENRPRRSKANPWRMLRNTRFRSANIGRILLSTKFSAVFSKKILTLHRRSARCGVVVHMNHFVKPRAIELARIAEARNGRMKFNPFVKPRAIELARIVEAGNGRMKFNPFVKPRAIELARIAEAGNGRVKTNVSAEPSAAPNEVRAVPGRGDDG